MLAVALPIALGLTLAGANPQKDVLVIVPLCDGSALACGNGALGDPRSLGGNLYWGAMYGAERFLAKAKGFRVVTRTDAPDAKRPALLRVTVIERAGVRLTLQAWDGTRIDDALAAFLDAARAAQHDLVVWAGHDRLMDVSAPVVQRTQGDANVAVLACESAKYFGPVLDGMGAEPLVLTRTFMAPEAYLLEALANSIAQHGLDRTRAREALVAAYAKYQRISRKAAGTVFTRLD